MTMKKIRNIVIDIIRVICMIEIIGYWHLCPYLGIDEKDPLSTMITSCVLATFTFLSGYFLGKKQQTAKDFYKKRLMRFYPLYALACLLMFFGGGGIKTVNQLILALTGTCALSTYHVPTLWYLGMLMVMYLLTPLMLYGVNLSERRSWLILFVRGAIIEAIFIAIILVFQINTDIAIYYPFYMLGIIMPFILFENIFAKYRTITIIMLPVFVMLFLIRTVNPILWYLSIIVGSILIVCLGYLIWNIFKIYPYVLSCFGILSYASLCAYLFHRHVYKMFKTVFVKEDGNVPLYIGPLMVIGVFIIAFFIQKGYDWAVDKYVYKTKRVECNPSHVLCEKNKNKTGTKNNL